MKKIDLITFLVICVTGFFCPLKSTAQKKRNILIRYWDSLVNDTTDISKPQLLVYPTAAFSPETNWEFGVSSLYVFYAKRDTSNRLSEVNGFTFLTLKNQYGVKFDHALYSHQNNWSLLGKIGLQSFPILYFGIGPATADKQLAVIDANQIQIKERLLRKVAGDLYFGLEMDMQRISNVEFHPEGQENFSFPKGSEGSTNFGFGAGVVLDHRHNVLNVRKGFFSELALLKYQSWWGNKYNFVTLFNDNRIYKPLSAKNVIAFQLISQFNSGNMPFNHLALMGGESMMRGYYSGRYRDNNIIATQVELRFLPLPLKFTKRFGASLFMGTGKVFPSLDNFNMKHFVLAGGGGLRFLIFPKKDVFTRLDAAFTRQ